MERKQVRLHRILRILMALCAAGALLCAVLLALVNREYAKGDAAYQTVRAAYKEAAANASPNAPQPPGAVDFSALETQNPDVVAWLTLPGTEIDYPVVQGTDNEYYLRHLFSGEVNKLGSIFMDYRSSGDFSDPNTILYGHNMKDGSMFSSLTKYVNQDYYDRFPAMTLYTPGGNFVIELFLGVLLDASRDSIRTDFENDGEFLAYVQALSEESLFESDTVVGADDRIVTLCTCSYEFHNARYALFGKLTPAP